MKIKKAKHLSKEDLSIYKKSTDVPFETKLSMRKRVELMSHADYTRFHMMMLAISDNFHGNYGVEYLEENDVMYKNQPIVAVLWFTSQLDYDLLDQYIAEYKLQEEKNDKARA